MNEEPSIQESPPELRPEQKDKIESLFNQLKGASGSNGLKIIEALYRSGEDLSNKDLAKVTNLSVKTVSRYRGTKSVVGYIEMIKNELTMIFLE